MNILNNDIDWVKIIEAIGTVLVAVMAALPAIIVAIKRGKENNELKKENREKDTQLRSLHNGFRERVYNKIKAVESKVSKLDKMEEDIELLKKAVCKKDKK